MFHLPEFSTLTSTFKSHILINKILNNYNRILNMDKLKTKIIDIDINPCFLRCFCTMLPLSIYFLFATFMKRVDFFCYVLGLDVVSVWSGQKPVHHLKRSFMWKLLTGTRLDRLVKNSCKFLYMKSSDWC